MIWPQLLLADGQRPLHERLGLRVLALRLVQHRQVVQAGRRVGMLWPQLVLTDGQAIPTGITDYTTSRVCSCIIPAKRRRTSRRAFPPSYPNRP